MKQHILEGSLSDRTCFVRLQQVAFLCFLNVFLQMCPCVHTSMNRGLKSTCWDTRSIDQHTAAAVNNHSCKGRSLQSAQCTYTHAETLHTVVLWTDGLQAHDILQKRTAVPRQSESKSVQSCYPVCPAKHAHTHTNTQTHTLGGNMNSSHTISYLL